MSTISVQKAGEFFGITKEQASSLDALDGKRDGKISEDVFNAAKSLMQSGSIERMKDARKFKKSLVCETYDILFKPSNQTSETLSVTNKMSYNTVPVKQYHTSKEIYTLTSHDKKQARELGQDMGKVLRGYTSDHSWDKFLGLESKVDNKNILHVLKGYQEGAQGMFFDSYGFFEQLLTEYNPKKGVNTVHIAKKMVQKVLENVNHSEIENPVDKERIQYLKAELSSIMSDLETPDGGIGKELDNIIAEMLVIMRV